MVAHLLPKQTSTLPLLLCADPVSRMVPLSQYSVKKIKPNQITEELNQPQVHVQCVSQLKLTHALHTNVLGMGTSGGS